MKNYFLKIALLAVITAGTNFQSFSQFTIQGEIRPRTEFRNGYKKLPDSTYNYAAFVSQRSRLGFNYKGDKITMKVTFQDVRVWGDEALKTDVPNIALYEAWAEMPICDSLSLRVGKQEFVYDNERLLSNNNWTQLGSTHNAALLKYRKNGYQVDFAAAFNQSAENLQGTDYSAFPNNYKTLDFLWLSKQISDEFKLSLLGIADGYQKIGTKNTTYIRGTYGGIANYTLDKKFVATVRGFYQSGRLQTGQQVAAYYGNFDVSYTFAEKFTLWLGMEYLSGNNAEDTANRKSNGFSCLYGTGHKFNGNMDYFTNFPNDTKGAGLVNPYLDFIYQPNEKWQARADFLYFRLQNNYLINNKPLDKGLGTEADVSCKYCFTKETSLTLGFSVMRAEKSMEAIVGGNSSYYGTWAFAMLTFKPTLFSSDKK